MTSPITVTAMHFSLHFLPLPISSIVVLISPFLAFDDDHSLILFARSSRSFYSSITSNKRCWNHVRLNIVLNRSLGGDELFHAGCFRVDCFTPIVQAQLKFLFGETDYLRLIASRAGSIEQCQPRNDFNNVFQDMSRMMVHSRLNDGYIESILDKFGWSRFHDYRAMLLPPRIMKLVGSLQIHCELGTPPGNEVSENVLLVIKRVHSIQALTISESGDLTYPRDLLDFGSAIPFLTNLQSLVLDNVCISFDKTVLPLLNTHTLVTLVIKSRHFTVLHDSGIDFEIRQLSGIQFSSINHASNNSLEQELMKNDDLIISLAEWVVDLLENRKTHITKPEVLIEYSNRIITCQNMIEARHSGGKC